MNKVYTTKGVAASAGIHANTVRFYEKIGFLTKPAQADALTLLTMVGEMRERFEPYTYTPTFSHLLSYDLSQDWRLKS